MTEEVSYLNDNKKTKSSTPPHLTSSSSLNESDALSSNQEAAITDKIVDNPTKADESNYELGLGNHLKKNVHQEHNTQPPYSSIETTNQLVEPPKQTGQVEKSKSFWGVWNFWNKPSEDHQSDIIDEAKLQSSSADQEIPTDGNENNETNENTNIIPLTDDGTPSNLANSCPISGGDGVSNNISTVNIIQETAVSENPATVNNVDGEGEGNFFWNMTRRVSIIPYLPSKANVEISTDALAPNKCSTVTVNNHLISTTDTEQSVNIAPSSPSNEPTKQISWWTPWKWEFNKQPEVEESISDLGSGIVEDELLKVQRREVANQIKCQSYGIPKSVVWGMLQQDNDEFGYVHITGNGYKKPIMMKQMPVSAFELTESQLVQPMDNKNNNNTQLNVESIVLPDIEWNYRDLTMRTKCRIALSKISILQSIFIPQSHLYFDRHEKRNHTKSFKKVEKKALVISFHGFLPQKIVKNIIGEGTGSSEQMSSSAIKELQRWSDIQNVDLTINTINLEGHGKLFERVNESLSILDSWIDTITNCDYVLIVSSSHTVPLAVHVISRLITAGHFEKTEKLGFIGFSGILMGPIPEVESKISTRGSVGQDNEIISEMFDLEDPESLQSRELIRNMKILIKKNFKITFVGSLNDCFSSLYSSLGLRFVHPNIYRAIYIDGSQHQPDFLTSLFNLILAVKNLIYHDHGLLLELSNFFIGQIGDGQHSQVLKNKYGYRVGINNMLNTCDLLYEKKMEEELTNVRECSTNSYHIPWCLRGFLEELSKLQKHFDVRQIIEQLHEEFKAWEPETQKMKELRYCMLAFENVLTEDLGL